MHLIHWPQLQPANLQVYRLKYCRHLLFWLPLLCAGHMRITTALLQEGGTGQLVASVALTANERLPAGLKDELEARAQACKKFAVTFLRPGLFCLSAKEVMVTAENPKMAKAARTTIFPLYVLVK